MKRIAVVGAGGHAKVVIEAIQASKAFEIAGVVDPRQVGDVLGIPWLGGDDVLPSLLDQGIRYAVAAVGDNRLRQSVGERLAGLGYDIPAIIHPSATISPTARIGQGSVVMARACIGPLAMLGNLCIVNTAAIVEHDNHVGLAAHIAPGVSLGGSVRIGSRTLIGIGSSVRPGVSLGQDVTVGAGSAVVSDFPDGVTIVGVPARILQRLP